MQLPQPGRGVGRWGDYSCDCLWISHGGARPWSDLICHPFALCPQLSGLKGVFVGLPSRPSEESESSMSLYKQVQGSENHPLPGGPGGTAMPEVS